MLSTLRDLFLALAAAVLFGAVLGRLDAPPQRTTAIFYRGCAQSSLDACRAAFLDAGERR